MRSAFLSASVHKQLDLDEVDASLTWRDTAMVLSIASASVNVYTAKKTDGPEAMAASGKVFRAIEAAAREIATWCERQHRYREDWP